jgi:hypothetical protein
MFQQGGPGGTVFLYGRQRNHGVANFILERRADSISCAHLYLLRHGHKNSEEYPDYCRNMAIVRACVRMRHD